MTYQDEKEKLKQDMDKKFNALAKAELEATLSGETRGLDSKYDIRRKELMQEQNQRLSALKKKYDIN